MPPNLNSHVMSHAVSLSPTLVSIPDASWFPNFSILRFLYRAFEKGARNVRGKTVRGKNGTGKIVSYKNVQGKISEILMSVAKMSEVKQSQK